MFSLHCCFKLQINANRKEILNMERKQVKAPIKANQIFTALKK